METRNPNQLNTRIRQLIEQSETLWRNGQLEKAENLAQEALQLANQDPTNLFGQGDTLHNLGLISLKKQDYSTAEHFLNRALTLWEKGGTQKDQMNALLDLGDVYAKDGRNILAKGCFHRALVLSEQLKDLETSAGILLNLGVTYWRLGGYSAAETHYQRSIAIYKELGDEQNIVFVRNNLAAVYRSRGDYLSAKKILEQNIAQIAQSNQELVLTANRLSLARLHLEFDAIDDAASLLNLVKPTLESSEANEVFLFFQILMGQLKLHQYELSSALEYTSTAKSLLTQMSLDYPIFRLTDVNLLLIQVHLQLWLLNKQEKHKSAIKTALTELTDLNLKKSWFWAYIELLFLQGLLKRAEFDLEGASEYFLSTKKEAEQRGMSFLVNKAQTALEQLQDQMNTLKRLYKASPQAYEQAQMLDVLAYLQDAQKMLQQIPK
ncbi:MAG: tetratricopeptide repeat protein [Promethearchaeota archaeon]